MRLIDVMLCLFLAPAYGDDITVNVFGSYSNHYLPAAFGDFNADKLTDMFVIEKLSNGSSTVSVMLSYSIPPYLRPDGPMCLLEKNIISAVPSDFDGDGAMDILVVTFHEIVYECYILWGDLNKLTCIYDYIPILSLKTQPLLVDYNGDMISDIYGENINGTRNVWIFKSTRDNPTKIPIANENGSTLPPFRSSGGHAFVDVDGDLEADILVANDDGFEIWLSSDDFKTYTQITLPQVNGESVAVIGQTAFCDLDMDGTMEMLLPLCVDVDCFQSFLYVYDFSSLNDSKWYDLKVNLKDPGKVQWTFPSNKAAFLYTNTISPRVGDANLDGYPDILITVFNGNSPKVILLVNSECHQDCFYPRTLIPKWNTFNNWQNSVMGTFFDFLEDGTLDVLLVNSSTDGSVISVGAYKDSVEYDVMFLKVLVLTGVCYNNCPHSAIPYGTNQPGPSVTYTMTSATGGVQKACAAQMSQTSHFALQLPFTVFGLGRNWNFIDKLIVGIQAVHLPVLNKSVDDSETEASQYLNSPEHSRTSKFTQIIPNSQLVVIPFPLNRPSQWTTKLFITPSRALLMTAGALIATCLFVGAIIIILHLREKWQDKLERRQQAQSFHFDAM